MIFFERQTKGIIAICIALAIIPFIIFTSGSKINYRIPELADQFSEKKAVEIVEDGKSKGIYFVAPETSVSQLLKSIGIQYQAKKDLLLNSGMKIIISSVSENKNVTVAVAEIESAKRLALGMPLDINLATESDLILVTGIGEVTAKKILDMRSKLGRYKNIEQLTEIKGIKEKKLAKLRKYLYVEK
jgi:competence protein ComEA